MVISIVLSTIFIIFALWFFSIMYESLRDYSYGFDGKAFMKVIIFIVIVVAIAYGVVQYFHLY